AVKRSDGRLTKATGGLPVVLGAKRLGGIGEDWYAVALSYRQDCTVVGGLAEKIYRYNCGNLLIVCAQLLQRFFQQNGIHIPGGYIAIYKIRGHSGIDNGMGGCGKRQRSGDDRMDRPYA